jgi:hypothetical protein
MKIAKKLAVAQGLENYNILQVRYLARGFGAHAFLWVFELW